MTKQPSVLTKIAKIWVDNLPFICELEATLFVGLAILSFVIPPRFQIKDLTLVFGFMAFVEWKVSKIEFRKKEDVPILV